MTHESPSCDFFDYPFKTQVDVSPFCKIEQQFLINQLDGNDSLSSESLSFSFSSDHVIVNKGVDFSVEYRIPVFFGNRPLQSKNLEFSNLPRVLKTIRRDNKSVQAISLPVICNYNMRSIFPKINSYAEDFYERGIGLSFLSEIWERSSNKKHQYKLQELFEMKGILYISTPRPGLKRGGGVALAADPSLFTLSKLNVPIPHQLEVS